MEELQRQQHEELVRQQQQQHAPNVPPQHYQQQHFAPPPQHDSNQPSPWYESLPAVAMDYKVHIDPGKEDCYFQYVNPSATFYVSFQVLRGGDGKAGFAVRSPSGQIVHPYQWRANADYQEQTSAGGYYSVCVDNQFSRFAGKLVNLYITVIRYDQWDKFSKELEAMDLSVENVTTTLMGVEKNINEVMQIQHFSRSREDRDYNLLLDNNSYVQNWSLLQVIVILFTTFVQVYFVRQLFEVKPGGYAKNRI
ncbi:unnamed protein product [Trichogramma brassicae]|uniref:GOLD domain-containing protein n=1 Tax=Trichogramma brassicae TaxID=86971 RepID=A0A6H5HYV8_9HYME|nr:unnamed protein product [Trichogramma brassicae]